MLAPADEPFWPDPLQAAFRRWLIGVSETTGKSPTRLARECGMAATTLTRFINNPDVRHTLSARTIQKIAAHTGTPAPVGIGARADTDPETLQRALADARKETAALPPNERDRREAQIAAEVYDALIDAQLDGQSLEEASRVIRSLLRRQSRGQTRR